MKNLLFAIAACCFLVSCNSDKGGGVSATAQKNMDAMKGITKCFDTKDFSKLGDYIAEDAVDHAGEQGDVKGLANMKAAFTTMVAGYDSSKTEVIKALSDDEYVMSWQRYNGTLKTPQMGMKAGDKFSMSAIEVAKFKDGKAVEHWTFMQPGDMMKMMGNMQPAMTTMVDSVKEETPKK